MATLNDGVMSKLSAFSGTANDKISAWLRSLLSPSAPATATLDDLWLILANQYGYLEGTTQEKKAAAMAAGLAGVGVTGLTNFNDLQRAFWNSLADIPVAGYLFDFDSALTDLPDNLTALGATFTRASVKNVVQDGLIVELAIDQFGTSYDSVTGRYAYWAEGDSTNLVTESEKFNVSPWTPVGLTVSDDSAISPRNDLTASIVTETSDVAPDIHYVVAGSVPIGVPSNFTFSAFIKAVGREQVALQLNSVVTVFQLSGSGSVVSGANGKITTIGNGWYHCSVKESAVTDVNIAIYSAAANSQQYIGDGRIALQIWGAQLEEQLICSSYIQTSGGTAIRSTDYLSIPTSSMPDFSTSGYSMSFDARMPCGTVDYGGFIGATDGTSDNALFNFSLADQIGSAVTSNTVLQANVLENTIDDNEFSFAVSYSVNEFLRSFDGTTGTSVLTFDMPIGINILYIGSGFASLNGYLFNVGFYMNPKTQDELNRLTS